MIEHFYVFFCLFVKSQVVLVTWLVFFCNFESFDHDDLKENSSIYYLHTNFAKASFPLQHSEPVFSDWFYSSK